MPHPIKVRVYLIDEDVWGDLVSLGTYASRVRYSYRGISYDVVVSNENLVFNEEEV